MDNPFTITPPNFAQNTLNNLNIVGGLVNIRNAQEQQAMLREKQRREEALERQWAEDSADLIENPSPKRVIQMMAKYPDQSENFKRLYDSVSSEGRMKDFELSRDVYMALQNEMPEQAEMILKSQREAALNSNNPDAVKRFDALMEVVKTDKNMAKASALMIMQSMPEGQDFVKSLADVEKTKAETRYLSAQERTEAAKAQKAAVAARFAESQELGDLVQKGVDISAFAELPGMQPINREIAKRMAAMGKTENALKREKIQLEIDAFKREQDQKLREARVAADTAFNSSDMQLSLIDRILTNPQLDNVIGSLEGSTFYPTKIAGLLAAQPFSSADESVLDMRSNAIRDIETLNSQNWLEGMRKIKSEGLSLGALTEQESKRIETLLISLSREQSEKKFKANLAELKGYLNKVRTYTSERLGAEAPIPDTPGVIPEQIDNQTMQEIDSIYRTYGVQP